jgi:hypothetical protein
LGLQRPPQLLQQSPRSQPQQWPQWLQTLSPQLHQPRLLQLQLLPRCQKTLPLPRLQLPLLRPQPKLQQLLLMLLSPQPILYGQPGTPPVQVNALMRVMRSAALQIQHSCIACQSMACRTYLLRLWRTKV